MQYLHILFPCISDTSVATRLNIIIMILKFPVRSFKYQCRRAPISPFSKTVWIALKSDAFNSFIAMCILRNGNLPPGAPAEGALSYTVPTGVYVTERVQSEKIYNIQFRLINIGYVSYLYFCVVVFGSSLRVREIKEWQPKKKGFFIDRGKYSFIEVVLMKTVLKSLPFFSIVHMAL